MRQGWYNTPGAVVAKISRDSFMEWLGCDTHRWKQSTNDAGTARQTLGTQPLPVSTFLSVSAMSRR